MSLLDDQFAALAQELFVVRLPQNLTFLLAVTLCLFLKPIDVIMLRGANAGS